MSHQWKHSWNHNIATTSLLMICCTRREQLFAWKTAYPNMTIDVMTEKSWFIWPGYSLSFIHGPVSMFSGPHCRHSWRWRLFYWDTRVGCLLRNPIFNNVLWTVYSVNTYTRTLHWAVSWVIVWCWYSFIMRDNLRHSFSLMMRGRPVPSRLLLVSPSFISFS